MDCKTEVDENGDLSSFFQEEQQLHDETLPISCSLLDETGKHEFIYALFLIMLIVSFINLFNVYVNVNVLLFIIRYWNGLVV